MEAVTYEYTYETPVFNVSGERLVDERGQPISQAKTGIGTAMACPYV